MALPSFIKEEQFLIKITHIPTDESVKFYSWLTGFTDAFNSTWAGTPVYGRMDDLLTFTKTSRVITIAFDVVAKDATEARQNQRRLNKLTQFLYPVYSEPHANFRRSSDRNRSEGQERYGRTSSQVLQAAPLLKMKFNSLVQNAPDGGELVGYLNGFTYAPDLNAGQFFSNKRTTRDIVYQLHSVQLTFNVLHTHLTGWVKTTSDVSTDGRKSRTYSFGSAEDTRLQQNYPRSGGFATAPGSRGDGTQPLAAARLAELQRERDLQRPPTALGANPEVAEAGLLGAFKQIEEDEARADEVTGQ